jgi:hypothetical protein
MTYNYNKLDNRRKAKFMLNKLLAQAHDLAKQVDAETTAGKPASRMGANMVKHLRLSAINGVHIYQDESGRWFADLTFEGLPPGVPDVIGTPSTEPHRTREEAVQEAIRTIATVIHVDANRTASDEAPEAVFDLDDIALTIPSGLIRDIKAGIVERPGAEYMAQGLNELRDQFAGGKRFTAEIFENWPEIDQRRIVAVAALALTEGMIRWPNDRRAERPIHH